MKQYSKLRGWLRVLKLFATLSLAYPHLKIVRPQSCADRSAWRMRWCQRVLAVLGIDISLAGNLPANGLVVSNHLGYLDVLILGALLPAVFISKDDVKKWPLVGVLCGEGGTLFLDRTSARAAAIMNRSISQVLQQSVPVVVFPEGTTTGGNELLPFHAALFEPAVKNSKITPAALAYATPSGNIDVEAGYYGDHTFVPHLANVMRMQKLRAEVKFGEAFTAPTRSEASAQAYAAITELRREVVAATESGVAGHGVIAAAHQTTLA